MSRISPDLAAWEEAAPRWIERAEEIGRATGSCSAALLSRLAPAPGEAILDIACGVGDPSLAIARAVGPSGRVLATDGVAAMVATTAARAEAAGLDWLGSRHQAAEDLEPTERTFDAACCRFGSMFFGDPDRALSRIRACLRPGGRLVLVVWGDRQDNPYFTLVADVLDEVGAAPPPPSDARRTVFEYGEAEVLAALVRDAGFSDVRDERVSAEIVLADTTPATLMETQARLSDKVELRWAALGDDARRRARALAAERSAGWERDGAIVFPATVRVVTGRAP